MAQRRFLLLVVVAALAITWWKLRADDPTQPVVESVPIARDASPAAKDPATGIQDEVRAPVPIEGLEPATSKTGGTTSNELRGYVTWRGNGAPVAGVRVVVFDDDAGPPAAEEVLALPANTPALASAMSDNHGHFVISGVSPTRKYGLIAGSRGITAMDVAFHLAVDGSEISVPVVHASGALLQLVTEGKSGFDYPVEQRDAREYELWLGDDGAETLTLDPAAAALAGVPPTAFDQRPGSLAVLCGSDNDVRMINSNRITLRVPGYEKREVEFVTTRLDDELRVTSIPLVQHCAGWGEIELRPKGMSSMLLAEIARKPLRLSLQTKCADRSPDHFLCTFSSAAPVVLTGLPLGAQPERVFSLQRLFTYPLAEGAIIASDRISLDVDFSNTGFIRLSFKDSSSVESAGAVRIMLSVGSPQGPNPDSRRYRDARMFDLGPSDRLLGPLNSGIYTITCLAAKREGQGETSWEQTLNIDDGHVVESSFTLAPRAADARVK